MAITSTLAQDAIGCVLCDMPSQQFCNNCQINLCVDCISNHVDSFKSVSHDIVLLKNRKTQLKYHECKFHYGQLCEANCQSCHTPVCMECLLADLHRDHNVVKLIKIVEEKSMKSTRKLKKLKQRLSLNIRQPTLLLKIKYSKLHQNMLKQKAKTRSLDISGIKK